MQKKKNNNPKSLLFNFQWWVLFEMIENEII